MESAQVGITAGVGVFGIVLGTIARPYFEEWFARRKKTLPVVVYEPSEFRAPHDSVVLSWHNESVHRIIQSGFRLENRTGRTLRNFRLEIGAKVVSSDDQLHAVYLEESDKARLNADNNDLKTQYLFELMEPSATVSGSMLSNYPVDLQVIALDDLEIRRITRNTEYSWDQFLKSIAAGVLSAVATLGVVALTALISLLGDS